MQGIEESKDASSGNGALEQSDQVILRQMYKDHFPDLISTIVRLKNSKIDSRINQLIEALNQRLLNTVIQIFKTKEEYEFIFARLKKEFKSESANSSQT